jgi:2-keto-4-pentenoate hydratase/2-oxohepta-3-ene-1,7-dioic acid hydratase in catechol pathway
LWGRSGVQEPPPLKDGDTVTLTVQGLGSLTNRIVSAPPAAPIPPFRRVNP